MSAGRLRRDPDPRRRARRTDVRVDEVVRMPTDLGLGRGVARRRPAPRVLDEPVARVVIPPAVLPRRGGARPRVPGPGGPRLRAGARPVVHGRARRRARRCARAPRRRERRHHRARLGAPSRRRRGARGSSAFDGDPATAWTTEFGQPQGQWVEVEHRAADDVRPPRPAGRGRRPALGADPAARRRGRRVAHRRPARDRRPVRGRRDPDRAPDVRAARAAHR